MKRQLLCPLLCACLLLCAGCGSSSPPNAASASSAATSPVPSFSSSTPADTGGHVDVDLTVLSSTMVYAEVYNMMTTPAAYVGKTVKVSGEYYAAFLPELQQVYFFVLISDAAACCQQGLEFIWSGNHTYPNDYPEDWAPIQVTGVFSSYQDQGETFYYLVVDEIVRL